MVVLVALVNSCEKMYAISGGSWISRWGGGANLQRVHFSAKTYVKKKEIDPVGGGHTPWRPPGSANGNVFNQDI